MNPLIPIGAFAFGAVIGSFLNVCIHRLPRDESIVVPSSHCPRCNTPLRAYDNIPLVSYLILRGKCRTCRQPISLRYPVVEFVSAAFSVIMVLFYGLSLAYIVYYLFVAALIAVTFIDLSHQIIPDEISLPGIVVGAGVSWLTGQITVVQSLLGILVGGGSLYVVAWGYHMVTKREGMGGGDIKLLAMIGAFIGWKGVLFTILCSSLVGAVVGIVLMVLSSRADGKYAVPFGPFLSLGAVMYLFFGESLIEWYLQLLRSTTV